MNPHMLDVTSLAELSLLWMISLREGCHLMGWLTYYQAFSFYRMSSRRKVVLPLDRNISGRADRLFYCFFFSVEQPYNNLNTPFKPLHFFLNRASHSRIREGY